MILVVDRSRSMEAQDVRPSRLAAANAAAAAFLERVPRRLQVGIVTFSGDVTVVASPTSDHERLERSVAMIGTRWTGYGGTAIGDALARAVELGRDAMRERGLAAVGSSPAPRNADRAVTILFLSDGRQNRGILPPAEDAGASRPRRGIPVNTVALGTATGGGRPGGGGGFGFGNRAPDPATLRMIAARTGGKFFQARSSTVLSAANRDLGSRVGRARRTTEVTFAFVGLAALALPGAALLTPFLAPRLP